MVAFFGKNPNAAGRSALENKATDKQNNFGAATRNAINKTTSSRSNNNTSRGGNEMPSGQSAGSAAKKQSVDDQVNDLFGGNLFGDTEEPLQVQIAGQSGSYDIENPEQALTHTSMPSDEKQLRQSSGNFDDMASQFLANDLGGKYGNMLDFQMNGDADDWYGFVTDPRLSRFYSDYGDLSNRGTFDQVFNDWRGNTLEDIVFGSPELQSQYFGNAGNKAWNDLAEYLGNTEYGYNIPGIASDGSQTYFSPDSSEEGADMWRYYLGANLLNSLDDTNKMNYSQDFWNNMFGSDANMFGYGQGFYTDKTNNAPEAGAQVQFDPTYAGFYDPELNYGAYVQGIPDLMYRQYGMGYKGRE